MDQRLDYKLASPDAFKAMLHTEHQTRRSGLEESLLELMKARASQLKSLPPSPFFRRPSVRTARRHCDAASPRRRRPDPGARCRRTPSR